MAYTFTLAKDEIAERSQDTTAAHKTRCGEWLNTTMQEMCAYCDTWDWLQKTGTLAITAADQSYLLTEIASDVDSLINLRIESSGGFLPLPFSPFALDLAYPDADASTGRPEAWTTFNDTILIRPNPDAAYTVQVRYYQTVTDLSASGDTPPWPSKWDHVWLNGAMRYAYQFNDDGRHSTMERAFERGLTKMLAHKSQLRPVIMTRGFAAGGHRRGAPWPVASWGWSG